MKPWVGLVEAVLEVVDELVEDELQDEEELEEADQVEENQHEVRALADPVRRHGSEKWRSGPQRSGDQNGGRCS